MSVSGVQIELSADPRPFALMLGVDEVLNVSCDFDIRPACNITDALTSVDRGELGVVVLGPRLPARERCEILSLLRTQPRSPLAVLLGAGPELDYLQEFVDSGQIFYISRGALTAADLVTIIGAAMKRYRDGLGPALSPRQSALEYCARLQNQNDLTALSGLLAEASAKLLEARHAFCATYDVEKETLSVFDPLTRQERRDSAVSGLAAFAVRTGERVVVEDVGSDPRYDPETDNPDGAGNDRFLAVPISSNQGDPIAVVVVTRPANAPRFSQEDLNTAALLVDCAAPRFSCVLLQNRLEHLLLSQTRATDIFREEALDYHSKALDSEGNLLQTSPRWLKLTHWLIASMLVVCLGFAALARVHDRAMGPAIIRARSKVVVAVPTGGIVQTVAVSPGDRVKKGALLAKILGLQGGTAAERNDEELRAPGDGVVSDVRIHDHERLAPGDPVATIIDEDAGYELVVFIPGQYAPQLQRGMRFSFRIDGYPDSNESATIDGVGHEIIGPSEALRYPGSADTLAIAGPVIPVHSLLKGSGFSSTGVSLGFRDGMTAHVDVTLRSEPMIFEFVPGLEGLFRNFKPFR